MSPDNALHSDGPRVARPAGERGRSPAGRKLLRPNIVLIDFESVQPPSLAALAPDFFRVKVFVGATQSKLPFDLVTAMQQLGDRAEYIKIAGVGPNALKLPIFSDSSPKKKYPRSSKHFGALGIFQSQKVRWCTRMPASRRFNTDAPFSRPHVAAQLGEGARSLA